MVVTKRLKNGAWNLDKTHRTLFNPSPGRFYFVLRRQLFLVWQQVLTLLDTPPAEPHLVLGWSLRFGAGSLAYAKLLARAYGAFLYECQNREIQPYAIRLPLPSGRFRRCNNEPLPPSGPLILIIVSYRIREVFPAH